MMWLRTDEGRFASLFGAPFLLLASGGFSAWTAFAQPVRAEPAPARAVICADCHEEEASAVAESVHVVADLDCRTCHGGQEWYSVAPAAVERLRQLASQPADTKHDETFDHGEGFLGKPARKDIPERCGACHADVSAMNPYGLVTDQLAQYRLSGHGLALYERNEDRVAVCTDCHGTHEVLRPANPRSAVYAKNVPDTCGRCHSDRALMGTSHLNTRVVEEYRQSVHGQGLLEGGDLAMPNCATCHGNHSAVPPGFLEVGHVCGRCHQQEEQYFLESHHAQFPLYPRCVGCHSRTGEQRDHRIDHVVATPESLKEIYGDLRQSIPGAACDDPRIQDAFGARRQPPIGFFEKICRRCHGQADRAGHRVFFAELDERVAEMESDLYGVVRQAECRYGAVAARVDEAGQGVLLVTDEALVLEEMRTALVGLGPLQHTLDVERLRVAAGELNQLADGIDRSLDEKMMDLHRRHLVLIPMWAFIVVFSAALWVKYKRLKAAMVVPQSS